MRLLPEHPRVCGENGLALAVGDFSGGTSPRMRGKQSWYQTTGFYIGNIPAYAGKTCQCADFKLGAGEHPRVCGENQHHAFHT